MSNDLGQMTAGELLDWLMTREEPPQPWQLAVFRAAGLTDLALLEQPDAEEAAEELALLTDRGKTPPAERLEAADVERICRVGHQVYLRDRDSLPEWLALADLIDRADRSEWRPRFPTGPREWTGRPATRAFIAGLLAAGRGLSYGRDLVNAAAEHHVSPDTYGYGETITPATFTDLATAGLGGYELDRMLAERITVPEALDFTLAGCAPGAVIAAKHAGLPKALWKERTAGLNSSWFALYDGAPGNPKNPLEDGAIGRLGFTWDQLRKLVDHGWGKVYVSSLNRIWYGSKGGVANPTPAETVQIAEAGLSPAEMARWLQALTTRSEMGQFLFRSVQITTVLELVVELRGLGVTPASLVDYRYCGCKETADLLTAARAGVDAKRVKYLRATHGQAGRSERSKRIASLAELLDSHRRAPAGAAASRAEARTGG